MLTSIREVLQRRLSTEDLPRSHFLEIYGQSTKCARVIKISQVLVYYSTTPWSTTPFSGVLTEAYLESGRTSTMEFFLVEILNNFNVLTIFSKKAPRFGWK